ncbi:MULTISPECIES: ROK family protein [unclassified Spirosoma]|uniref:ROK family protein n=1 Tax=unclassified Spirosoma TaxID=2621999 RepID=UPI00095B4D00|nr:MULTISPECIES: ROK family protein [unclassified Spirosoma]MBN8821006.1 ROK family protein [Spirosoma sp.]OJW76010.1 MAG: sugar kinase [Spirosoma sp. 48-14]
MSQSIGIDLGGTRIKGVLIDRHTGEVLERRIVPTNDSETGSWKAVVHQIVHELKTTATAPIRGVGLAAPGLPTVDNSAIACMPGRLAGLEGFNWTGFLNERVHVLNDAHAAMMAEARFGAARNIANAALITLGTGVGGGLLVGGQLYQGFYQMAGHIGHITVDADTDSLDVTQLPGSLEEAIGNTTVSRRSYGRYHTTHELVAGYAAHEPLATLVWLTSVRRLAVAIASIANLFSPEVVILGGGITQANDALFSPLRAFMDLFEWRPAGKKTTLCKAHFEDWAGAIGAAACFTD